MLKEHLTLPAMQFFYIVQKLMGLHCYIYKKPSLSVVMYVPPALNLTNRQVSVGTTLYVDCLATTNGSQLALYYYGLADSSLIQLRKATFYRHLL